MIKISKSKYLSYQKCPKSLWLFINSPELAIEDSTHDKQIKDGKEVGALARKYFDNTVDVTTLKEDGSLNIEEMIGLTNRYLAEGDKTIAEASISIDGLFCSIDLLHPVKGGYEIYEVKATTGVEKEHYIDAAFQKYVLQKRGLNVVNTYILHLNSGYRRKGELELDKLFFKEQVDLHPMFLQTMDVVESELDSMRILMDNKVEPSQLLASKCKECPFMEYCHKNVPNPSVLDISNLKGRYDLYNSGVITYLDVLTNCPDLKRRQKVQIEAYLQNKQLIVDKDLLKQFVSKIKYPIYHLDFESMQLPIPPADDTWAYEQIPTQYSLHIEYEDGRLEHKEFLGNSLDPRRDIAEALCRDIPLNACVLAYNKTFECGRLNELADLYPDLRDHLRNISEHVVDLIVPFKNGAYYNRDMGGSNSIKAVLPALYPNDQELDYHALPVVHNGGEAMDIYPKMVASTNPVEKQEIRDGLLQYCCLDTLAMVKVLRKIKEALK